MYTQQDIIDIIFNDKTLYSLLVPEGINAYGIFFGGSRFLEINSEDSDYDLNIVVSNDDYQKLEKEHKFRSAIHIGENRIHWYYFPINPKFFHFDHYSYFGLEWWTTAIWKGITKDSFLKIINEERIEKFINNLERNKPLFKELMQDKYLITLTKREKNQDVLDRLWKKSYMFVYLANELSGTLSKNLSKICKLKELTKDINSIKETKKLNFSENEQEFIKNSYKQLKNWLEK